MTVLKRTVTLIMPLLILGFFVIRYIFAPNDPNHVDMSIRFLEPCAAYPLGTDQMGRCVLSRLLYGGKTTLGIVLAGSLLVAGIGTVLGLLFGYCKKREGIFFESGLNAVTAIPPIAYLIIFIASWGSGISTMLTAVAISLLLRLIKLAKTRTEVELSKAYVTCAAASGGSPPYILFIQIMPNIVRDVMQFICLSCADMVLAITGFSFIGLGLGDNIIDWGMMVSDSRTLLIAYPGLMLYPVVFITICTLCFHFIGSQIEKGGKQIYAAASEYVR